MVTFKKPNQFPLHCKQPTSERGFSLIEVSIALMIIGILMVPIIYTYNIYIESRKTSISDGVIKVLDSALYKYYVKYGRYPRPAQPNAAQGAANFGAEDAAISGWPVCTATSTSVCQTATAFGSSVVLIGDVPIAALGIPFKSSIDGFGNKLTYAVTASLTDELTFNNDAGAIDVLRDDGLTMYPTAGQRHSHFFVVSHGENSDGAFTLAGVKRNPCGTAATGADFENCNNDGVFRNNYNVAMGKIIRNYGVGIQHFDDFSATTERISGGVWTYIPSTTSQMATTNEGNVYVGSCTALFCVPQARIDVNGSVNSLQVKTGRICNSTQNNCVSNYTSTFPPRSNPAGVGWFSPETLTSGGSLGETTVAAAVGNTYDTTTGGYKGAGIKCYNGQALGGLWDYDEMCAGDAATGKTMTPHFSSAVVVSGPCPGGQYAKSVTISGTTLTINCAAP